MPLSSREHVWWPGRLLFYIVLCKQSVERTCVPANIFLMKKILPFVSCSHNELQHFNKCGFVFKQYINSWYLFIHSAHYNACHIFLCHRNAGKEKARSRLQSCLLAKVVRKAALPDSGNQQQAGLFQDRVDTGKTFSGCPPHQRTALNSSVMAWSRRGPGPNTKTALARSREKAHW